MSKYYRVKKENPIFEVGAVLRLDEELGSGGGYLPVDDIFRNEFQPSEYLSAAIVENAPDFFEQVHPVNLATKTVYRLKEEAKDFLKKQYKGGK